MDNDEFMRIFRSYCGEHSVSFPENKADYGVPGYSLVMFKPDKSMFYYETDTNIPITSIYIAEKYLKSPWDAAIVRRGHGEKRIYFMSPVYLGGVEFEKYTASLYKCASKAFHLMKHSGPVQEHKRRKRSGEAFIKVESTSGEQVVETPDQFYSLLDSYFGFDHDPCPVHPQEDAMVSTQWGKMNYINPPFKHAAAFCFRAVQLQKKAVVLCPLRLHNKWTRYLHNTGCLHGVIFLRAGMVFKGYTGRIPAPLMLVLIGPPTGRDKKEGIPYCFWDPFHGLKRVTNTSPHLSTLPSNIVDPFLSAEFV